MKNLKFGGEMDDQQRIAQLEQENIRLRAEVERLKAELLESRKKTEKAEVGAWADSLQSVITKYDSV